jgi:hypothetical protein
MRRIPSSAPHCRFRKFHERFAVAMHTAPARPGNLLSAVENKLRKITTEQRNPARPIAYKVIHNKVHALIASEMT